MHKDTEKKKDKQSNNFYPEQIEEQRKKDKQPNNFYPEQIEEQRKKDYQFYQMKKRLLTTSISNCASTHLRASKQEKHTNTNYSMP